MTSYSLVTTHTITVYHDDGTETVEEHTSFDATDMSPAALAAALGSPLDLLRYTTAPQAYDGFGTVQLAVLKTRNLPKGREPYRLVQLHPDHAQWQEDRYRSGMYAALPPAQYDDWVQAALIGE